MIVVNKLVKSYGFYPVLRGIDLNVEQGQFLALLGPNGSGKSTLLRILSGLSRANGGKVTIGGWELPQEAAAIRRQLGVVSHLPLLYDSLTAEENLMFFARLYGLPEETREDRVKEMLDTVGLRIRATDIVRTFSRGMLQRLAIARALLHDPPILLLDEPYTGLDQNASALLDELLRRVAGLDNGGRTAVMTTHNLYKAQQLTTHVAILSKGKVGYYGETEGIDLPRIYAETIDQ
jgi:heme exporter protein A